MNDNDYLYIEDTNPQFVKWSEIPISDKKVYLNFIQLF